VHSETKIFNLETHEFGSNPPFLKNNLAGLITYPTSGRNRRLKKYWREVKGAGALKKTEFENLKLKKN
jgi:hypothetical protein